MYLYVCVHTAPLPPAPFLYYVSIPPSLPLSFSLWVSCLSLHVLFHLYVSLGSLSLSLSISLCVLPSLGLPFCIAVFSSLGEVQPCAHAYIYIYI